MGWTDIGTGMKRKTESSSCFITNSGRVGRNSADSADQPRDIAFSASMR